MSTDREQKLVDVCFATNLLISDKKYDLHNLSNEEKAEWVAKQLRISGFDTKPCGSSWGVLKK